MKVKVEFANPDEFDDLVKNLAEMAEISFDHDWLPNGKALVKLLHSLLDGEIVEA